MLKYVETSSVQAKNTGTSPYVFFIPVPVEMTVYS
jgi:hypothetical protein